MLETPFINGQHLLGNAQNGSLIVLTVQTAIVIHALPKVGLTKNISTVYIINDIFAVDITSTGHLGRVPKEGFDEKLNTGRIFRSVHSISRI